MAFNTTAATALDRIAVLLELSGEDSFRASSNARAARTLEGLDTDAASLSRDELLALPGVGKKIADKIIELRETGRIAELDELTAAIPPGLLDVLRVQGLGPKTARMLWQQGGVTDLASLKRIIDDGTILTLPRMGAKSVEKIKEGLAFAAQGEATRTPLGVALPLAEAIVSRLRALPGVGTAQFAGSLRRGKETVGDIDILLTLAPGGQAAAVAEAFRTQPGVRRVLAAGETRSSVLLAADADTGRWKLEDPDAGTAPSGPSIQVDLRILPPESFGAALMYFTGSKEHNVALRERALARGLTLNEYGLFPNDDEPTPPQARGVAPVAARNEDEIYAALGLRTVPPELREQGAPLSADDTPRLITADDIRAELHAHTTASDGSLSIEALAREAHARGFHTIAVTDHSRSSAVANGLSPERLRDHIRHIRDAEAKLRDAGVPIRVLAGSEVDILADGSLDYDDDLLARLDIVVASPHAALRQDDAAATARLIRAVTHPLVHILGHPTGRLVNRRPGLSPAMSELLAAAREHRTALEINAHWMRLDLRDTHVRAAVNAGCLIAIDCDVHAREDFDNLRFGVLTARRGMLTPDRCLNSLSAADLHTFMKSKRR